MAERPRLHDLVALQAEGEALPFGYTQQQLGKIQDRTLGYLKRNRIPATPDTVLRAQAIVGIDAVSRTLLQDGRDRVEPTESIDSLVKQGLEAREHLKEQAKAVLEPLGNLPDTSARPLI